MKLKENLKTAIELYSGKVVKTIMTWEDPKVRDTHAIRVLFEGDSASVDFLIVGKDIDGGTKAPPDILEKFLEEVEFTSWPPKSGNLKFL